jgi:hypothetical protein
MSDFTDTFAVDDSDGCLIRCATPRRGVPYEHRCSLATFETVAHAIDDLAGAAFTMEDLRDATDLPWSQVAVAVGFLRERGSIEPVHGRKHRAATGDVHLDGMLEYHALREKGPDYGDAP